MGRPAAARRPRPPRTRPRHPQRQRRPDPHRPPQHHPDRPVPPSPPSDAGLVRLGPVPDPRGARRRRNGLRSRRRTETRSRAPNPPRTVTSNRRQPSRCAPYPFTTRRRSRTRPRHSPTRPPARACGSQCERSTGVRSAQPRPAVGSRAEGGDGGLDAGPEQRPGLEPDRCPSSTRTEPVAARRVRTLHRDRPGGHGRRPSRSVEPPVRTAVGREHRFGVSSRDAANAAR